MNKAHMFIGKLSAAERKQFATPITHHINYKDWYSATVELYTNHRFPNWQTADDLDRWWDIACLYHCIIYGKEYQETSVGYTHGTIFPDGLQEDGWPTPGMKRKRLILPSTRSIISELKKTLKAASIHLETPPITIKVFPRFCIDDNLTNALSSRFKKSICVFLDGHTGWQTDLAETMTHEYFHTAQPRYDKSTLGTLMLREGLADGFQEYVLQRKELDREHYTYKQLRAILHKYRYWLRRPVPKSTQEWLFTHNSMTHDVGYHLAQLFLSSLTSVSWYSISRMPTNEILQIALWALDDALEKR